MIGQLLDITCIPVKFEMQIEPAELKLHQNFIPQVDVTQKPARLDTFTRNIEVRLDSYGTRKSLGLKNNIDLARDAASRGRENIQQLTRNYVDTGYALAQIQKGTTIGDIIWQKTLEQPQSHTVFLPTAGTKISWQPNDCQTEYTPGELSFDWKSMRNAMDYIPGDVRINILQYPDVQIEYIGMPIYCPPSANPEYETVE